MKLTFLDHSGKHVTITTPITLSASRDDLLALRDLAEAALYGADTGMRVVVEEEPEPNRGDAGLQILSAELAREPGHPHNIYVNAADPRKAPVDPSDPSTWDYDPETIDLGEHGVAYLKAMRDGATHLAEDSIVGGMLIVRPPLLVRCADPGTFQLTPAGALVLDRVLARDRVTDPSSDAPGAEIENNA
jgi:hypothetical protein